MIPDSASFIQRSYDEARAQGINRSLFRYFLKDKPHEYYDDNQILWGAEGDIFLSDKYSGQELWRGRIGANLTANPAISSSGLDIKIAAPVKDNIVLFKPPKSDETDRIQPGFKVDICTFSPQGVQLVAATKDGEIFAQNLQTGDTWRNKVDDVVIQNHSIIFGQIGNDWKIIVNCNIRPAGSPLGILSLDPDTGKNCGWEPSSIVELLLD